jgi:hypothetical protein
MAGKTSWTSTTSTRTFSFPTSRRPAIQLAGNPMTDNPDGIGLLADFLDDVARFTGSRLMFPLVVLMIASIWIVAGCYAVLRPAKMVEINRRMRWLGSDPSSARIIGCIGLVAGFMALGVSIYFFIRWP